MIGEAARVADPHATRRVRPSIVPLDDGGQQFEWHERGFDIEVMVDESGKITSAYVADLEGDVSLEADTTGHDLFRTGETITDREAWLREHLPHLHVGRTRTATWHIISAGHGDPLCYVGSMSATISGIEEEGPLDQTQAGTLCAHCARRQGDTYAEW